MNADSKLNWFRWLARTATALALVVIVVGAWVRLTDAGLGCPDWPGCYGHVHPAQLVDQVETLNEAHPDRPFDYTKALNEMIHRYIASSLGLLIIALAVLSVVNRRDPRQPRVLPWVLLGVVLMQGLLGMWTVTLLLKPLVVTLHLLGGLTTLSLLWWLSLSPERRERTGGERRLLAPASAVAALVVFQIALGGWTSTNYAAAACSDFPTCQGGFWPDMDFQDAFVLWRGLGIDYEGGVLDAPARVAIHYVHRIGALAVTLALLALVAEDELRGRVRPVARPRHRLRGWRARCTGPRRDPLHASARRLRGHRPPGHTGRRGAAARADRADATRRGRRPGDTRAAVAGRHEPDLAGLAALARHGSQRRRRPRRPGHGRPNQVPDAAQPVRAATVKALGRPVRRRRPGRPGR
jgi:cytochrome c oxidase assembly protein subunit 15